MAYVFREYYVSFYVYLQNSAKMMVSDEHGEVTDTKNAIFPAQIIEFV